MPSAKFRYMQNLNYLVSRQYVCFNWLLREMISNFDYILYLYAVFALILLYSYIYFYFWFRLRLRHHVILTNYAVLLRARQTDFKDDARSKDDLGLL